MKKKLKKTAAQLRMENKIYFLKKRLQFSEEQREGMEIMAELIEGRMGIERLALNMALGRIKTETLSSEEVIILDTKIKELKQIKIIKSIIADLEREKKEQICKLISGRKIKKKL